MTLNTENTVSISLRPHLESQFLPTSQMRSGDLLAYLSLNCLSNGIVNVPDAIFFQCGQEIPFLRNSTRV